MLAEGAEGECGRPWLCITTEFSSCSHQPFFLMHFSSFQIWEGLTQRFHRVIALDFVGFGFSDKPVSSLGGGLSQLLLAQRLFCHASIPRKLAFAVQFLLPFTSGKGIRCYNSRKDGEGAWWRSALSLSCLYLGLM